MKQIEQAALKMQLETVASICKKDEQGYILMNEFAVELTRNGFKWEGKFLTFLKSIPELVEIDNTIIHAQKIRVKELNTEAKQPIQDLTDDEKHEYMIYLEESIKKYDRIFIDTCSLMGNHVNQFFDFVQPLLLKYDKKIVVPERILNELYGISKSKKNNEKVREKAIRAIELLAKPETQKMLDFFGCKDDNLISGDEVFVNVFGKFITKYNMALITCDKKLIGRIMKIKKNTANSKDFAAFIINKFGYMDNKNIPFEDLLDLKDWEEL